MRCSVNRLLQLATKPRLQSMRSDTSSQVWPSASSKISRARRASSARSVRLWARRVSSISSEFDNVMASLMDAIIVYKWLLQSTRRKRHEIRAVRNLLEASLAWLLPTVFECAAHGPECDIRTRSDTRRTPGCFASFARYPASNSNRAVARASSEASASGEAFFRSARWGGADDSDCATGDNYIGAEF